MRQRTRCRPHTFDLQRLFENLRMAGKRKHQGGGGSGGNKRKWQNNNTTLHGQGIFMTCPRGKERKAANEFVDILTECAHGLYPDLDLKTLPTPKTFKQQQYAQGEREGAEEDMDALRNGRGENEAIQEKQTVQQPVIGSAREADVKPGNDIESELRAELAALKETDGKIYGKGKKTTESRDTSKQGPPTTAPAFKLYETHTECLCFIGVHPQLDPFQLCYTYFEDIERTGEAKSRLISRLSPVSGFGIATVAGLNSLSEHWMPKFFPNQGNGTFKVEPRVRSHNVLSRTEIIDTVASYIPRGSEKYQAELKNPSHWVNVEVFKSQAAIGVLRDYIRFNRFNAMEFANAVRQRQATAEDAGKASRVADAAASKSGADDKGDDTATAVNET
ncbi:unnamed protein product [Sympodiomycopsis kandeliae]